MTSLSLGLALSRQSSGEIQVLEATGGTSSFIQQGSSYFEVFEFTTTGNLTVTGEGAVDFIVVAGSGNAGANDGAVKKFVAGESGNTEGGQLTLPEDTYSVVVGTAGGTGVAGGDSTLSTVTSAGGAAT